MKALLVGSDHEALRFIKINLNIIDPQIETELASSRETALERLGSDDYDCVVSEYALPDTDGILLGEEVKKTRDTPFILYTSRIDEELVEQAYQSGVDSVVRRERGIDHFNILARTMEDAVEIRWQRRLYKDIVENSRDAILIIVDGTIEYVNPAALHIFDVEDRSEIIGASAVDFLDPAEQKIFESIEAREREGRHPYTYDYLYGFGERLDRRFEASISFIRYHGEPALLAFVRDITDRVKKENLLQALHDHATLLKTAENVEEIGETTLDIMEKILGFTYASFHAVRGSTLQTLGTRGAPLLDNVREMPLSGAGITVKAAKKGETQYVPDTRLDPGFMKGSTDSLSELSVPVTVEEETVAVLNIESLELDAFTVFDHYLLEVLAAQVASAMKEIHQKPGII